MIEKSIQLERRTGETVLRISFGDIPAGIRIQTPLPMFSHLLEQLAFYAGWAVQLEASFAGPAPDDHHLVEDTAILLGTAYGDWLGDRDGLTRFGQRWLPMDDALALAAVDIGGRGWLSFSATFPMPILGGLACENIRHFFYSLAQAARITLHLQVTGTNTHHQAEALFKATGLALAEAQGTWPAGVRSTKGGLG